MQAGILDEYTRSNGTTKQLHGHQDRFKHDEMAIQEGHSDQRCEHATQASSTSLDRRRCGNPLYRRMTLKQTRITRNQHSELTTLTASYLDIALLLGDCDLRISDRRQRASTTHDRLFMVSGIHESTPSPCAYIRLRTLQVSGPPCMHHDDIIGIPRFR